MRRLGALCLVLGILLGLAGPGATQGPGLFVRSDCTTLTGPVTGSTWCFDSTARALKVWNGTAYDSTPVPPTVTPGGGYMIRNLVGQNDATTPNTKFGYSADLVQLRNPSDGTSAVRTNTGTLTCNLGTTGANGLDTGTQAASTWYHFYFIWNGTTLASIASTVAPPTGPTLPTGYTYWAYAGAVFSTSGTTFYKTRMRGSRMLFEGGQNAITDGAATSETAVSLTSLVPPNALTIGLNLKKIGYTVQTNTTGGNTLTIRVVSGTDLFIHKVNIAGLASGIYALVSAGGQYWIPNIGQQFFYLQLAGAGSDTPVTTIDITGYTVPNGGD